MAAGRHLGKFRMAISQQRIIRSTSCFILEWCFRGRRIEWRYFWLHQIQDGGWPPSWKISNGHISGTGRPIDFVFDTKVGRVFEVARSNGAISGCSKSRWWLAAVLENFEWPYLGNGSSDPLQLWFQGRVFEVSGSNGTTSGWTKSKFTAVNRLA